MMPTTVLGIGGRSFIASNWHREQKDGLILLAHDVDPSKVVPRCGVVVNFAVSPEAKTQAYREQDDADLRAARLAADHGRHFVMLSTRKVYAPSSGLAVLAEDSKLGPVDHYAANKLETERRVAALLGDSCTILRVANVYGFEIGRRSFFGQALTRLKAEQRIVFDVSASVRRDFIPVQPFTRLLDRICDRRPAGIYNVGSGTALALGDIARWLIAGYGLGRIDVEPDIERDAFVMNTAKIGRALGHTTLDPAFDFKSDISTLGKRLKDE